MCHPRLSVVHEGSLVPFLPRPLTQTRMPERLLRVLGPNCAHKLVPQLKTYFMKPVQLVLFAHAAGIDCAVL
jgi:hypothetical protein